MGKVLVGKVLMGKVLVGKVLVGKGHSVIFHGLGMFHALSVALCWHLTHLRNSLNAQLAKAT